MTTQSLHTIYRERKKILMTLGVLLTLLAIDSIILSAYRPLFAAPINGRDLEQTTTCGVSTYRVQPGDTIADVARRSGTSSQVVRQCNGLTSNVVQSGQQLALPGAVASNNSSAPRARVTRTYPQPRYAPASGQRVSPYRGRPSGGYRRP